LNKPDDGLPVFDPDRLSLCELDPEPKPPDHTPESVDALRQERDRLIQARREARDKRIERVGRALYGGRWIGELKPEEYEIGKANRANPSPATILERFPTVTIALPSSGKEAATIARAHFCYRASNDQTGQVIRWLNDLRILDASVAEFDAWFAKEFPDVSTQRRKDAVRDAWESGLRPGHGGNTTWEKFCNHVREQSGQDCDDRTIQRDVEELRSFQS
jgi:hypothetical protein